VLYSLVPLDTKSFLELRANDVSDLEAKRWSVICCRLPDEWPMNPEVLVYENIPESDDVHPRN
jgi:hypothetical protein